MGDVKSETMARRIRILEQKLHNLEREVALLIQRGDLTVIYDE